ncbi:MAG: iron-sulfur cluster repair di-iron protein [Bacteroidia bacterium]
METLDVTKIEPRLKHPSIFNKFDALSGGQAFILHNDHDPVPLYYQMIAERGQTFEWEYLQKGPEVFEIKITKLDTGDKSKTIGELVASDYRKAEVFRKFGLDFCCGGHKTLKEACAKKKINLSDVEAAIAEVEKSVNARQNDFNSWDLDFLADYIVNTHHKYVNESVPMLNEFSTKVARVHGNNHPEIIEIAKHYNAIAGELLMHMPKEESILFPYIKKMATAKRDGTPLSKPSFGSITNPIQMMESEHVSVGESMKKINELSGAYTPPADACSSYKILFAKLKEFEEDLLEHIHLENNILFPKAIELEKQLNKVRA